jgi:hypothetical protein
MTVAETAVVTAFLHLTSSLLRKEIIVKKRDETTARVSTAACPVTPSNDHRERNLSTVAWSTVAENDDLPGPSSAPNTEALALWQRTVETLVARGAAPAEAIDGANLLVAAYRRKRDALAAPSTRSSGVHTKSNT